jgi:hypothetical protein
MSIERKRSLPLLDVLAPEPVDARPSLETARKRMGGRARSAAGVGKLVLLEGAIGVLVFVSDDEHDVWVDGKGAAGRMDDAAHGVERGVVRRAKPALTSPFAGDPPAPLARVAADIRVFATLAEGDRVRYEATGDVMAEGLLLEKCRFGALVAAPDGRILAVGFRKLWPIVSGPSS